MSDKSFKRSERLKSRKLFQRVFSENTSIRRYPLNLLVLKQETHQTDALHKIGIAVPKRRFKKAVDRNLLKRRIREAYRTNKHILYNDKWSNGTKYAIIILYFAANIESFQTIERSMIQLLKRVSKIVP